MKVLSRRDIEQIATRVVSAYKKTPELSGKQIYRIDPEILCKDLLKLNVDYKHLSLSGTILGLTSYGEVGIEVFESDDTKGTYLLDGKTVLVERDLKESGVQQGRLNFTIIHEACHQIYKMLFPKDYGFKPQHRMVHYYKVSNEDKKHISNWDEWQANALASAILLPKDLIEQALFLFGIDSKIKRLNKMFSPKDYTKFANMAEFLGSSKTVLAIRMKQLGLLEQNDLDDPYRIIDAIGDE